jgi:uncharacterized sporulation protein YeaH/YhbH (DUF444 family)
MVDFSGSMGREVLNTAKRMVYDLQAILRSRYQGTEFRFVAFDGNGHIMKDLTEFLQLQLGGGTNYEAGFKMVEDDQVNFPRNEWDRYIVGLGDMWDFGSPEGVMKQVETLKEQTEFMGMIQTEISGPGAQKPPLATALENLANQDEYVGFVYLPSADAYVPKMFKKLFKNKD